MLSHLLMQVDPAPLIFGWRELWTFFIAVSFIALSYLMANVLSNKPAEHMQKQENFKQGDGSEGAS